MQIIHALPFNTNSAKGQLVMQNDFDRVTPSCTSSFYTLYIQSLCTNTCTLELYINFNNRIQFGSHTNIRQATILLQYQVS